MTTDTAAAAPAPTEAPKAAENNSGKKAVAHATGFLGWTIRWSWVLAPITMILVGWGMGQTYFPQIHTRIVEWGPATWPVVGQGIYPIKINPLPLGGGSGMGLLLALGAAWLWRVHSITRDENASAKVLKGAAFMSIYICVLMAGILLWKLGRGTASYWIVPSFIVSAIGVHLAVGNAIHTLSGRDVRRGVDSKD